MNKRKKDHSCQDFQPAFQTKTGSNWLDKTQHLWLAWTKIWKLASFTITDFCDVAYYKPSEIWFVSLMVYVLFGALLLHITETDNLWLKKKLSFFFNHTNKKRCFKWYI